MLKQLLLLFSLTATTITCQAADRNTTAIHEESLIRMSHELASAGILYTTKQGHVGRDIFDDQTTAESQKDQYFISVNLDSAQLVLSVEKEQWESPSDVIPGEVLDRSSLKKTAEVTITKSLLRSSEHYVLKNYAIITSILTFISDSMRQGKCRSATLTIMKTPITITASTNDVLKVSQTGLLGPQTELIPHGFGSRLYENTSKQMQLLEYVLIQQIKNIIDNVESIKFNLNKAGSCRCFLFCGSRNKSKSIKSTIRRARISY